MCVVLVDGCVLVGGCVGRWVGMYVDRCGWWVNRCLVCVWVGGLIGV